MTWVDKSTYDSVPSTDGLPHVTEDKIIGFSQYRRGWHYGEGVPFGERTIGLALKLHQEIIRQAFFVTDAFPGLQGQILVTIYYGDHYLEFTVEPDETISFCQEEQDVEILNCEGLSFEQAIKQLQEFRRQTWKGSGSSAEYSMTPENTGSRAPLLGTQVTSVVFPLSAESAYVLPGVGPVVMSESITGQLPENQSFSGCSRQTYSQAVAG